MITVDKAIVALRENEMEDLPWEEISELIKYLESQVLELRLKVECEQEKSNTHLRSLSGLRSMLDVERTHNKQMQTAINRYVLCNIDLLDTLKDAIESKGAIKNA